MAANGGSETAAGYVSRDLAAEREQREEYGRGGKVGRGGGRR